MPGLHSPDPRNDGCCCRLLNAPLLKICGLRDPHQAAAVARLGADAIGVIAVPGSPRWLEPEQRGELFAAVAGAAPCCQGVLVVADPSEEDLALLDPAAGHRIVQLHGREAPQRCAELRQRLGCQVWKALRIRQPSDLEQVEAYAGSVDAVLLDAWAPEQLGGTGKRLPLEWLQDFRPSLPWWLAGGLGPDNAAAVLKQIRPTGLDVSSGVERAPGDKDLELVKALVEALAGPRRLRW